MKFGVTPFLGSLILGTLTTVANILPAQAAAKINFIAGPLKLSLPISSLEAFAADGTVDRKLADYLRITGANEQEKAQFRKILLKRAEIDPFLLSQLLRTEIGEALLSRWGEHIAIEGGRNGKDALREAIVKSSFDVNGLSLINLLRYLPTNIQINIAESLSSADRVNLIITATNFFRDEIIRLARQEIIEASAVDFTTLRDLRQKGEFRIEFQQWKLNDASRERTYDVDVYQPQKWRDAQIPVVIVSHGLGSSPQNFADYAQHLASYGYVVAIPQHPGSDKNQIQDLKAGLSGEIFPTSEFIDRPRDISYVIDELERRNQKDFAGRLELNQVAVIGHSFGGYTALAIAGATIDFEHLKQECDRSFNISLLLQCRALSLEPKVYDLKDERVKVIAVTNPFKSAIFGPVGLASVSLPIYIQAGVYDLATPFVLEQVRPFPWLNSPMRYLSLQEGDTHADISKLDASLGQLIDALTYLSLPEPALLRSYNQALILAFLEVHLLENGGYRPYLQSAYADYLSQGKEFKAFLITNASTEGLKEAIAKFKAQHPNLDF